MNGTLITVTRKIGQNRGKPRLWIEGQTLIDAGLPHGTRWDLCGVSPEGGFTILAIETGRRKVSGKPDRPVIDIAGSSLGALGDEPSVALTYSPNSGHIVVRSNNQRNATL